MEIKNTADQVAALRALIELQKQELVDLKEANEKARARLLELTEQSAQASRAVVKRRRQK
jgi:hypothetical protein